MINSNEDKDQQGSPIVRMWRSYKSASADAGEWMSSGG